MTYLELHSAKSQKKNFSESQVLQYGMMPFTEITTADA